MWNNYDVQNSDLKAHTTRKSALTNGSALYIWFSYSEVSFSFGTT